MTKIKKVLFLSLVFSGVLFAADQPCAFCNEKIMARQMIRETEQTITIYCLTPTTKGNLLIIPKRHIERFELLTPEEMLTIQEEVNLFSKVFTDVYGISEFVLIQKNGKNAGQSVAHLHFHMVPAPKPFEEMIQTAFLFREKISDQEMQLRTQELREYLATMPTLYN